MNFFTLLRTNPRYLGYGFLHYFFSFAGQTFFIGLFVAALSERLGWENTDFSRVYALVTLISAFVLPRIGKFIDRFRARYVSTAAGLAIALGCGLMALNEGWLLFSAGLLLTRMGGQGVLTLIGATTIGRFFTAGRGQALSLSIVGVSVAEILLPPLAVALLLHFGLTASWLVIGGSLLFVFVPLVWLLVPRRDTFQTAAATAARNQSEQPDYSRRHVLRDRRFYTFLPAILFPPFFLTGAFLNQNLIADAKGWTLAWMAWCFSAFGIARVAAIFSTGGLVDRLGAQRVVRLLLVPTLGATLGLVYWPTPLAGIIFMVLAGLSAGASSVTGPALWAELYGQRHLGSIKSMITMLIVFSSAIAPPVFSYGLTLLSLHHFFLLLGGGCLLIIAWSNLADGRRRAWPQPQQVE